MKKSTSELLMAPDPSRGALGHGLEGSTRTVNAFERGRYDPSLLFTLHNGPSPGPSDEALLPPPN